MGLASYVVGAFFILLSGDHLNSIWGIERWDLAQGLPILKSVYWHSKEK